MLKYFIAVCLGALVSFKSEAKIIETAHIAEALPFISEDCWFLVDLDNTLFEAKQALGHANWFYDEIQARMQRGMTREEAIRDTYPDWIKIQSVCPVKPLEDQFISEILSMQHKGVVVMGLTHRQPSVSEATLRQVNSLGIDFKSTAPSQASFTIPSSTPTLYVKGILFVGDYNKKGEVFIPFLNLLQKSPKKIAFIDDKRKNVEELEQALAPLGIEYLGIYYTAAEHEAPIYSRELAQFQYKFLDKIMSNEAAQILIQQGIGE